MALGSDQQTITTGANFIPELWGPAVISATEDNLVFDPLVWDLSDPAKGKGDTIHLPAISNFTANTKSANTQVVLNAPTEGVTNLLIDRHEECSFLLEDLLKIQMSFPLMKFYTGKAGFALAEQRDTRINNLVASFSQIVGSSGVNLGDEQIRNAIEFLDLANAPMTDRHFVIYPTQKNALFAIDKYFRADQRGDGASKILTGGKFGEIYGMPVYVSNNIGTSGTPAARLNAMFHREAIAIARQEGQRVQSDYILEYLGNLVVADNVYGIVETRDTFGVWLRS